MSNAATCDDCSGVEDSTPYRVLVTGVPLHVSCEAFYDALRAHTAEVCVHNAWLVQLPCSDEVHNSITRSNDHEQGSARRATDARVRSTGAAFVDFCSKHAADAVMRAGDMYVDGVAVCWEGVGPVVSLPGTLAAARRAAAVAAHAAGKAAYEAHSLLPPPQRTQHDNEDRRACLSTADAVAKATTVMTRNDDGDGVSEVTLRLTCVDDTCSSPRAHRCRRRGCRRCRSSDNADDTDAVAVDDADLFTALDTAVRRRTRGCVHSLERLCGDEVHLVTDEHSAALLLARGHLTTSCRTRNDADDTAATAATHAPLARAAAGPQRNDNVVVLRWRVHAHRRRSVDELVVAATSNSGSNNNSTTADMASADKDGDESNLVLVAKHEVLQAMATVMQQSGGKYAALQDKYGNLLFPADIRSHIDTRRQLP